MEKDKYPKWERYKLFRARVFAHAEERTEELEAQIFEKFINGNNNISNNMKAKKLRGEFVLIEPDLQEEVTASGIALAKKPEQGDFSVGTVKMVGTGRYVDGTGFVPVDLVVGDKVLFQYGFKIKVEDTFLLLVNESDVKLVLE